MTVLIRPIGFGPTHGSLTIHSAPKAVLNHLQWGISDALATSVNLKWEPQVLSPSTFRTELSWSGIIGTGSKLVSMLKGWHYLVFELHEAAGNGSDGALYMFAPELGLFSGAVGPHGDLVLNENQIRRALVENPRPAEFMDNLERLLGRDWDDRLDPFRRIAIGEDGYAARLSV